MGRKSRQSFVKRVKERKRQEKAALKRQRRHEKGKGKRALLLVDIQNDFCSGGAAAVPGGEAVLPVANRLIDEFAQAGLPVFATRDWHPAGHCSFKDQGGDWPPHCVAETPGAGLHPELRIPNDAIVVSKGTELDRDAYSGFQGTPLAEQLKESGVTEIVVCGLATDYCVKQTAIDGRQEGFEVVIVQDGIRGIDVQPGDSVEALSEMERAGARITSAGEVLASATI